MKKNRKLSTITMVQVSLFAAITAVLSQISIPLPSGVPITLQTLAIALCGYVLGWKLGLLSTGVYILLGAVGLPVFASLRGGPGVLFGVTGGFIWGFLALAGLCGMGMQFKKKLLSIMLGIAGLCVCHLLGALQFSLTSKTTFVGSLMFVSVPYFVKDVICVAVSYLIAVTVRTALNKTHFSENG